ncbi:hypothetical protein ACFQE1_02965 [Halobium palmae]|uniref:Uncharacterized protein n=1 Tax=Halobium palmae TaxID=1776492 RepID=A0ABD5RW45_9EURY
MTAFAEAKTAWRLAARAGVLLRRTTPVHTLAPGKAILASMDPERTAKSIQIDLSRATD